MSHETEFFKHLYWMTAEQLEAVRPSIEAEGIGLEPVTKTACQTLKAVPGEAYYAAPEIWSGMCKRQGSWYRESARAGQYLVVSDGPLPACCDPYLDATIATSDFAPDALPDRDALGELVDSEPYQSQRPDEWERVARKDRFMLKLVLTLTGFWGWGDNLGKHWLGHRANHANFLTRRYTTEVDGEQVPYSVTGNEGVCSSCVEFFNVIEEDARKLVRACPGSVTFAKLERGRFYDVVPVDALRRRPARAGATS